MWGGKGDENVGGEKEKTERERETGFDLPRRLQTKLQKAIDLKLACL